MRSDEPGFVSRLPGLDMDAHDNAMTASGSNPSRSSTDAVGLPGSSGVPGVGTIATLASQADPGSAGTNQPGQNDPSAISPGPAQEYVSTGASGSDSLTDHWGRSQDQQPRG